MLRALRALLTLPTYVTYVTYAFQVWIALALLIAAQTPISPSVVPALYLWIGFAWTLAISEGFFLVFTVRRLR